jgi:hypothetical protein
MTGELNDGTVFSSNDPIKVIKPGIRLDKQAFNQQAIF